MLFRRGGSAPKFPRPVVGKTLQQGKKKKSGSSMMMYFLIIPLAAAFFMVQNLMTISTQIPNSAVHSATNLAESATTIVTAFYSTKKGVIVPPPLLQIQDPMIIFTQPELVELVKSKRSHATNRTVVIPASLLESRVVQSYPLEVWKEQQQTNGESSVEEIWIQVSKTWFLSEAVQRNPFHSTHFIWIDCTVPPPPPPPTSSETSSLLLVQSTSMLPENRLLIFASHQPNPPADPFSDNERTLYTSSAIFGSSSTSAILQYHLTYMQVIKEYMKRKQNIANEKKLLQSTCLQHDELCSYIVTENGEAEMLHAFQKGKKFSLISIQVPKAIKDVSNSNNNEAVQNVISKPVQKSNKSLPSTKLLLTKTPPFDESNIIKMSEKLIKSPNTVVTAYYRVKSKFKPDSYTGWMKNMLSLQDAMVIFTSEDLVPQIQELRSHAVNRTVIIHFPLDDLPIGTLFPQEFWEDQLRRDPERRIHQSFQLFWIWLSKSWWVTQAIRLNFFDSDLFVWSDIGCFRHAKYNYKVMVQHRDKVPPHEMLQMAHHKPDPPSEVFFNDKYNLKDNFYHSGSQMAAYLDTWNDFHAKFLDTIDGFLERNMIIVEDQAILESTCLRFPQICAYVPFNQVKDNHYFGLRYVLYHGGEYNYWRKEQ